MKSILKISLLIFLTSSFEVQACRDGIIRLGRASTGSEPVIPVSLEFKFGQRLEGQLPKNFKATLEGIVRRIQAEAPMSGNHVFHWEGDRNVLKGRSILILFTHSKNPEFAGYGQLPRYNMVTVTADPKTPNRLNPELLGIVQLDHFFKDPSNIQPEELAHLELFLASDLFGRFRKFMQLPLDNPEVLRNLGKHSKGAAEIEMDTFRGGLLYLQKILARPDFRLLLPGVQAFFKKEKTKFEQNYEKADLFLRRSNLETVVAFDFVADYDSKSVSAGIPNIQKTVLEILERLKKFAPKDMNNLFFWSGDRDRLEKRDYTLVLTTRSHPEWGPKTATAPADATGSTTIHPETLASGTKINHIIQFIYMDRIIPPGAPAELHPYLLEAILAFEILGRSHILLDPVAAQFPSMRKTMDKVLQLEADAIAFETQVKYFQNVLRDEKLSVDRRKAYEFLLEMAILELDNAQLRLSEERSGN